MLETSHWLDAWREAYPRVFRALVAMGARPEEAEDALQDALERALRLPETPTRLDGWLFVAAVRKWRTRRRRDRLLRPLAWFDGHAPAPDSERLSLLVEVRLLSPRQQQVLIARYWLGLSLHETAELLKIAPGTVGATASQALRRLRIRLEARDEHTW